MITTTLYCGTIGKCLKTICHGFIQAMWGKLGRWKLFGSPLEAELAGRLNNITFFNKMWYNSGAILELYHKVIIWMKNIFLLPTFIGNVGKHFARHLNNITFHLINITFHLINITFYLINITFHLINITFYLINITTFHLINITFYLINITFNLINITFHLINITFHLINFTFHLINITFYLINITNATE